MAAIKSFIDTHSIPGVSVDPSNPQTVVFTLTRPATYFVDQLAMPVFSPAPVEYLNYLPASDQLAQHTISDGPYRIESYVPGKSIVYVRNPVWKATTDPVRKAYVDRDRCVRDRQPAGHPGTAGNQHGCGRYGMGHPGAVVGHSRPCSRARTPTWSWARPTESNPYIVFNEVSPNNGGALANVQVRQALEYGINRTDLVQDDGGPQVSPPLTHVLPPGIVGSQNFDPYPYNPQKAEQMLSSLAGRHLTLKLLYVNNFDYQVKMFQTLQADLAKVGVTVQGIGVPNADFFTKYMEVPTVAHGGVWDMAFTAWYPDWYGNGALSFFNPLFSGPPSYPPSGSNFGFYNSSATNQLIQQAEVATSISAAAPPGPRPTPR